MQKISQIFEQMEANKDSWEFLKTGFPKLDKFLDGGFLRKELVVLGGHTGVGKSYLAGQIMYHIATQGYTTAFFSLEMSNEMVVSRLVGALANLKSTRVRTGFLTEAEQAAKDQAKADAAVRDDYMDFHDEIYALDALVAKIREHHYDFVVVDFIQNVMIPGTTEYDRLSRTALELQKLAKEIDCCIVLLSQLSNQVTREGGQSGVVEYKGSGSIATVCDLGFIIHRPESEDQDNPTNDQVELYLRKNRRGMSGVVFKFTFKHPGGYLHEC